MADTKDVFPTSSRRGWVMGSVRGAVGGGLCRHGAVERVASLWGIGIVATLSAIGAGAE